jgi:hypothetical protein
MGDAGEALVDTEARLQERIDQRNEERRRRQSRGDLGNPNRLRAIQSLRLARAELERQAESTQHVVRREQIAAAIAEIDRRIAAAG